MNGMMYPCSLETADSTDIFKLQIQEIVVPEMGRLFVDADSSIRGQLPYLFPWRKTLEVGDKEFCILIIPQLSGQFVTRASTEKLNANGQGRTEEEALENIKEVIELLLEEEQNLGGEVAWPEDFQ